VAILKGVRKVIFGSPDPGLFGMTPEAVRAVIDHAGGQIVDIQEITGGPAWGAPLTTSVRGRGFRGYPISLDPFVSYRYLSRRLAPSRGSASGRDTGNRPPSE